MMTDQMTSNALDTAPTTWLNLDAMIPAETAADLVEVLDRIQQMTDELGPIIKRARAIDDTFDRIEDEARAYIVSRCTELESSDRSHLMEGINLLVSEFGGRTRLWATLGALSTLADPDEVLGRLTERLEGHVAADEASE